MRKIDLISEVYRETLRDVTKDIPSWKSFLHTAAFQYKYPFDDQVLIHAQRPDATACAEIELWNKQFGRWVNKGAKGIALIAEGHGHQYLRYVFDVADTHHRDNVPFDIWHNKPEQEGEIITALENRYGELPEKSTLENSMMFACTNAVVDNTPDYLENLRQSVVGSRLENVSEKDLAGNNQFPFECRWICRVCVKISSAHLKTMILANHSRSFLRWLMIRSCKANQNLPMNGFRQRKNTIQAFQKNNGLIL